jgi:hypothetical protein
MQCTARVVKGPSCVVQTEHRETSGVFEVRRYGLLAYFMLEHSAKVRDMHD